MPEKQIVLIQTTAYQNSTMKLISDIKNYIQVHLIQRAQMMKDQIYWPREPDDEVRRLTFL